MTWPAMQSNVRQGRAMYDKAEQYTAQWTTRLSSSMGVEVEQCTARRSSSMDSEAEQWTARRSISMASDAEQ